MPCTCPLVHDHATRSPCATFITDWQSSCFLCVVLQEYKHTPVPLLKDPRWFSWPAVMLVYCCSAYVVLLLQLHLLLVDVGSAAPLLNLDPCTFIPNVFLAVKFHPPSRVLRNVSCTRHVIVCVLYLYQILVGFATGLCLQGWPGHWAARGHLGK